MLEDSRSSCIGFGRNSAFIFAVPIPSAVAKAMKWEDLTATCTSGDMEGTITAGTLEMTPKQKDLFSTAELRCEFQTLGPFEIVRLEIEGKKGKGFRREFRFNGTFDYPEGAATFESYMNRTANTEGTLTITYLKENVQTAIELTEAQQATLPEND